MAQQQPLFEMLFEQHFSLSTTTEVIDLMDLPPSSPGELYAGWGPFADVDR